MYAYIYMYITQYTSSTTHSTYLCNIRIQCIQYYVVYIDVYTLHAYAVHVLVPLHVYVYVYVLPSVASIMSTVATCYCVQSTIILIVHTNA